MDQFIHLLPLAIATTISLGICVYIWQHRYITGASIYAWVALSQALTTIAYMFELIADDLYHKIFWDNVQWLTLSMTAVALIAFSLQFTDNRDYKSTRLWWLTIPFPFVFMLLVITNHWHHLTTGTDAQLVNVPPFWILEYELTPLALIFSTYLLGLAIVAIAILVKRYRRSQPVYQKQQITVIIGILITIVGAFVSLSEIVPGPLNDVNPYFFSITNIVIIWGLRRYGLFEVAPIARHSVLESMTDALIIIDLHGRIVDVNHAAQMLTQRLKPTTPIIGVQLEEVFSGWATEIEFYNDEYEPFTRDIVLGSPPHQRFVDVSVAPVITHDGLIVGRSILLKDVTKFKQTEIRLIEQAAVLEIAKQKAEETDHFKSQFLADVSHELRTPLNAIINFNQFVSTGLYGSVTDKQTEALDKSTGSARHLLALINDILDRSKIEAGYMELAIEHDVDLKVDIGEVVTSIETLIADKPVSLRVEYPDNLPLMQVDRKRIRQVLLNLLSNAAKFTEVGHITLKIVRTDNHLLFAVNDTGPGITITEQSLIFEPFRQAKRNKSSIPGTGLGLPISQRLIQAHGGELWLESIEGKGSTFFFTLPITVPNIGKVTQNE